MIFIRVLLRVFSRSLQEYELNSGIVSLKCAMLKLFAGKEKYFLLDSCAPGLLTFNDEIM
jgi:hypothetical protein